MGGYSGQEIKEGTAAANRIRVGRQRTRETLRLEPMFKYNELVKRVILNFTIQRPAKQQERKLLKPYKQASSLYLYQKKAKVNSIQRDILNDSINFSGMKGGVRKTQST